MEHSATPRRPGPRRAALKIEFVNHASFVVEAGPVKLLVDPWFDGRIFNDGWELLAPTRHDWGALSDVTHLWFSHEHPDHFHPRTLGAMPEELRARVEVLYQRTLDHKVVGFCRKLGFASIRELDPGVPAEIAPGIEAICAPMHPGDSWLALRTPGGNLLDLNDCEVSTPEQVREIRECVGAVDVLLTQFSIAAWGGNADEPERLRDQARQVLERVRIQAEVLEARFVVPFASFVWFCHEENRFMNDGANRIEAALEFLAERSSATPVILYPGDRWQVGEPHDPASALSRWSRDYAAAAERTPVHSNSVEEADLLAASRRFVEKLRAEGGRSRMRLRLATKNLRHQWAEYRGLGSLPRLARNALLRRIEPSSIHVTDLGRSYLFDLDLGLRLSPIPKSECDIWLSSDSLHYCFDFLWGGDTLQINGRFHETRPDSRLNLFEDLWMAKGLNAGDSLTWGGLLRRVGHRLRGA